MIRRSTTRILRLVGFLAVAMALCVVAPRDADGGNPNPGIIPPQAKPYGLTYGEWATKWWQYVYSIPVDDNPLFDETGALAGVNQSGPVFFLVGVINVSGTAERTITVPHGKSLFFPIINFENDNFCPPQVPPLTVGQLRAGAAAAVDGAIDLFCEIDGVEVENLEDYRVTGPAFTVNFPDDNVFQFFGCDNPAGTYGPFVNDGFYLMLAPLSAGEHTIHFSGAVPSFGGFTLDITYHIAVTK